MKNILLSLFLIPFLTQAQKNYSPVAGAWEYQHLATDSVLSYPTGCGFPAIKAGLKNHAALYTDSCLGRTYFFNPHIQKWMPVADSAYTDSVVRVKVAAVPIVGTRVIIDSSGSWLYFQGDNVYDYVHDSTLIGKTILSFSDQTTSYFPAVSFDSLYKFDGTPSNPPSYYFNSVSGVFYIPEYYIPSSPPFNLVFYVTYSPR